MLKTCQSLSSKIFEKHSPTFLGSYSVPFWEWASSRGHLSPKPETQGRKVSPLQGQRTHAKRNGAGTGHPRGARLRHRRCPRRPRVGRFCREKQDDALCLGSPPAWGPMNQQAPWHASAGSSGAPFPGLQKRQSQQHGGLSRG